MAEKQSLLQSKNYSYLEQDPTYEGIYISTILFLR